MGSLLKTLDIYTVDESREKCLTFIENFNNSLSGADLGNSGMGS